MRLHRQPTGLRLPRHTIRVRLALSYWRLFVASGAVLLAVTVALWQGAAFSTAHVPGSAAGNPARPGGITIVHGSDLKQLLIMAGIALAIMAVVSIMFGWLVAGQFLRPVRIITAAAREISATSLHKRLNLQGPDDELKALADTFDDLLARLDRSFQFERRFVANASHELRTPLATMRVWLDVAMAKPGPLPPESVALAGRIRHELDQIDTLLEGFLTLARTQQVSASDQATIALSSTASAAIERRADAVSDMALTIDHEHCPQAAVTGSQTLLSRMIENVIDNAIRHNNPGGWVRVRTPVEGSLARVVVENGGATLTQGDVDQLGHPFHRLGTERTRAGNGTGLGLGLSIVKSIAEAHGGSLSLQARPDGGLRVTITLPRAAAAAAPAGQP